jgi:hypothetical protein
MPDQPGGHVFKGLSLDHAFDYVPGMPAFRRKRRSAASTRRADGSPDIITVSPGRFYP